MPARTPEQYAAMIALYREWNERINVVSRKDADALFEHHILHSLALGEYVRRFRPDAFSGAEILDLGTGGGFPGIPLATEFPGARFTLCDSIGKKIRVAQAVADGLGLHNVRCINARAESLDRTFDWVVSRAVTTLAKLYPWVRGRFRRGILCLKGGDVDAEVAELVRKCRVEPGRIRRWRIGEWLEDEYYAEKFVIEIGKDYFCPPKSENQEQEI